MRFVQFRLAKRNGELVQQSRIVISTTTSKWYKPWDTQTETYESEWQDVLIPVLESEETDAYCNGFCGEYECKENQANCKRLKK